MSSRQERYRILSELEDLLCAVEGLIFLLPETPPPARVAAWLLAEINTIRDWVIENYGDHDVRTSTDPENRDILMWRRLVFSSYAKALKAYLDLRNA